MSVVGVYFALIPHLLKVNHGGCWAEIKEKGIHMTRTIDCESITSLTHLPQLPTVVWKNL